jgi:hypothetical protein
MQILLVLVLLFFSQACGSKQQQKELPQVDPKLELETRLKGVDFSIVQSDSDAVHRGREAIARSVALPEPWPIDFAGTQIHVPSIDSARPVGLDHSDGRFTVAYLFPDIKPPKYGEFAPLAIAQYIVPEGQLDIVVLIVCFQSDPQGSLSGLGVKTLDTSGWELSAPFALAVGSNELKGKFFYDEFLAGGDRQAIAGRPDWDRGFMLLTRLDDKSVLSTYAPWY